MPKRKHLTNDNEDIVEASSSASQRETQFTNRVSRPPTNISENDTNTLLTGSPDSNQYVASLAIGDDGYAEGSIVCIVLQNFMTYGYCKFYPGPQLNLIIGPNGTGKSSIVCALALGLGSHPSLLGRSKSVAEFVKAGETDGSIQIELKKVHGQNIIIQRNINKDNKSTWKLSGRSSSYHDVRDIVKNLHIQVDNLCQFLPQDKVSEFAQLEPPLLLMKTLEATGKRDLKNELELLIEKQGKKYQLDKSIASQVANYNNIQGKTQLVAKDVEKFNERQQLMNEITLLQARIPLAKFSDAKKRLAAAKEDEQLAQAEKSRLERDIAPLDLGLQTCKDDNDFSMLQRSTLVEHVIEAQSTLKATTLSILKQVQETKQRSNAINGIKNRMKSRQQDRKNMEQKIAELEAAVSVEPPNEDPELEENIKLVTTEINDVSLLIGTLADTAKEHAQQIQDYERQVSRKKIEINQLKDTSRLRLNALQHNHSDAFKAYMWYREHKTLFRGQIFGPIQLSLNLKDKKYMDYVETALGGKNGSHLQTFVCEYAEDYRKLMAELVDHQRLRLTASWPGDIDISSIVKTPCSEQKLKDNFGLDHFVINLIEGPPLVLAYLCQQSNINCIPVGLQHVSIEKIVDQSYFQKFIVSGSIYHVKKYTYGLGGAQTTVRPISRAVLLTDKVNREAYEQKLEELKQLEITLATIDTERQALATKKQEQIQKLHEMKHQRENQKAFKRDIQDKHNQWEGQKKRLARYRQDLESLLKQPAELEQDIEGLKIQIVDKTKHRGQLVVEYLQNVKEYVAKVVQRNKLSLTSLSSHAMYQQMKTYSKSQQVRANEVVKKHKEARQVTISRKADVQVCHQEADQAGKDLPDDLKDEFKKICASVCTGDMDETQEEIEDGINDLLARKNAITMTNPVAIITYERLLTEKKTLEQKIDNDKHKADTLSKEMAEVFGPWKTRLEQLVSRIDKKFAIGLDRIGCAGQVALGCAESFEKWGIEIRVKFRDHEKLQRLTGCRQSGGERAVSTILYLMALQNLTCTPFRVVDEINQGMDPRNERMIHEQIIKGASHSGTSQYFIITPKLLTDLYYDDCMRVLCIYNGEWQPNKLKPLALYLKEQKLTRTHR